jgi:hypothetical protein
VAGAMGSSRSMEPPSAATTATVRAAAASTDARTGSRAAGGVNLHPSVSATLPLPLPAVVRSARALSSCVFVSRRRAR